MHPLAVPFTLSILSLCRIGMRQQPQRCGSFTHSSYRFKLQTTSWRTLRICGATLGSGIWDAGGWQPKLHSTPNATRTTQRAQRGRGAHEGSPLIVQPLGAYSFKMAHTFGFWRLYNRVYIIKERHR